MNRVNKCLILNLGIFTLCVLSITSNQGHAYETGDWVMKIGSTTVDPNSSSEQLKLNNSQSAFITAVGPEKLNVNSDTQLGITIEYFINSNWGVELLASTPFEHSATATTTLHGLNVAKAKHLPPTFSAIYHFNLSSSLNGYLGLGINYTLFFNEETTPTADQTFATLGLTGGDIELDDSIGIAIQVGIDYEFQENWFVNSSIRWMDLNTTAEITFDNGSKITSDIDIDPIIYSLMLAYKF